MHRVRAAADHASTSVNEFLVLSELAVRPDGMTGAQVAGLVGVGSGGMTGILDRLEEQELIDRSPDPSDGRGIVACATDSGHALLRDEDGDVAGAGVAALVEGLGADQIDVLTAFLGAVTDRAYRQSRHLRGRRPKR